MARQGAAQVQLDVPRSGRELLEAHYNLIQRKLEKLGRQSGLPEHEAEEFRSWALLKLVEDDYRILEAWEGRSSFSTYLNVVLLHLMQDYRTRVWGRWRPSAAARRLGPEAVLLERLWHRDGLSLNEAIMRLCIEHRVALSPAELERMAGELPRRAERRQVGEEELQEIGWHGTVESRVEADEHDEAVILLRRALVPALRALSAEDRLLLKLSCRDDLTVAAISSALARPQKSLYSARDRCLKTLRRALEQAGLTAQWLRDRAGAGGWDFLSDATWIWDESPDH